MITNNDKISDSLDYNLDNLEERMKLVNKLIEENDDELVMYYSNVYNPHIDNNGALYENTTMGKDLEALATYILNSKDVDAEDTLTDYKKDRNNKTEANIEKMLSVRDFKNENNKSIFKKSKIKVTEKDRKEHVELARTGEAIKSLEKMIKTGVDSKGKTLSEKEIRRLKWIKTDIQKDEVAIKNELKRYIRFKSITKSEPDYEALGYIRFDDVEIIRILIENYSELKQQSYEDTYGYLKLIMMTFDDLVQETEMPEYMKYVMVSRIDNIQYDKISEHLQKEYNVKLTRPRISKMIRETIPKKIVETYKQKKEDWVYTFVFKGEYKMCENCKRNLLATTRYFHKSNGNLRSMCKECRNKKYKKAREAKKV